MTIEASFDTPSGEATVLLAKFSRRHYADSHARMMFIVPATITIIASVAVDISIVVRSDIGLTTFHGLAAAGGIGNGARRATRPPLG